MQPPKPVPTNLLNICEGAIPEVFDRELQEVLNNIADMNTSATVSREVILRVKISPSESRQSAALTFTCTSKIAPVKPVASTLLMFRDEEQVLHAYSRDIRQEEMFAAEQAGGVVPLVAKPQAG